MHEFHFAGSRTGIRKRAAKYGCHLILKMLDQK
nr:hypothetical protein P5646_15860 [Bacillus velezensis]